MNWEAIGAIGEILGAIAVFASLIYLAIQIRGQIRQQRKLTIDQLTQNWMDILETQTRPEVAEVWISGLNGVDALSTAEKAQFYSIAGRVMKVCEGFYLSFQSGELEVEAWEGTRSMLKDMVSMPGVRAYWHERNHWYTRSFCGFVDETIEEDSGSHLFPDQGVGT